MNISVIVPTLNEEACLHGTLEWLRRTSKPPVPEVLVVDGGSVDKTLDAARGWADRVIAAPRPGRAFQMHLGAQAASGNLLLFLHADTLLPEGWQKSLARAWSSEKRPAATAFRLGFDREDRYYRWVARLAHWRTLWTGVPHGDQAIAVSREAYFAAGGFPDVPLMEEYLLFGKLNELGPVRILPELVRTSSRRYERTGTLAGNLRNLSLILGFYLGVPPRQLASLYP